MTLTKTAAVAIKAVGTERDSGLEERQFRALVSVFGNVDSDGDVVVPGAFTKTLATWEASGDPIPLVWSHKWDDPFAHIGHVVTAAETDQGLEIVGEIDTEDNPLAAQVYRLLKSRRVRQFSYAYDVEEGGYAPSPNAKSGNGDEMAFELRELTVHEIGPCLLGSNRETDLRDIKRDKTSQTTGAEPVAPTGTSQNSQPREDTSSNPPPLVPARVLALTESLLITEGV